MEDSKNIRKDAFVVGMLERISPKERDSFSDDQLLSLKLALGTRTWKNHSVDLRWSIKLWRKSLYFVFIAGKNSRPLSRREQDLAKAGKFALFMGIATISTLLGLLVLYLLKSALGINIFPGFSLGIWDSFKELLK